MSKIFSEKNLENFIVKEVNDAIIRGFSGIKNIVVSQLTLPTGKVPDIVSYSIIDNTLDVSIYELKKDELGISAAIQLIEYGQHFYESAVKCFDSVNIELFLVGDKLTKDMAYIFNWGVNIGYIKYLIDLQHGIRFTTYKYINEDIYSKRRFSALDSLIEVSKSNIEFKEKLIDIYNSSIAKSEKTY